MNASDATGRDLLYRIATRLRSPGTVSACAPALESAVTEAESALGLRLPPALRAVYLDIANGGFGPGYGVIGVRSGHPSNLGTLVTTYEQIQAGARYLGIPWQRSLVPFCEWGCNIFSCVDCDDEDGAIYTSEECRAYPAGYTLARFFAMWLDGTDILSIDSTLKIKRTIVNPFAGALTNVSGTTRKLT